MKKHILIVTFLIINIFCFSQHKYPKDYFSSPLKIPLVLSGTFGELRTGHFHSGLDIKTQGKEGVPIYAPADGYVSRIKVSQWGYGKALYINHPNGYGTVYGHLQKYAPKIQKYIKSIQYKKERYAIGNIFPNKDKFKVKRGEIIGYTGDTGGSGGPHLHYEIRNLRTGETINPFHFGVKVKDERKPVINRLAVYPINNASRINNTSKKIILPLKNTKNEGLTTNTISANGEIGFAVSVYDQLNGAENKNGIYSLEMKVNNKRHYYHNVDKFAFPESKFINLLIDYQHYKKYKKRLQKTFKHPKSTLSLYKNLVNGGKINIKEGQSYKIEVIAKDFKGNSSSVKIDIKGVSASKLITTKDTTAYKITTDKFHKFKQQNVTVAFPKKTFYNNFYLDFEVKNNIAKVHNPTVPLDKRYTLTFQTDSLTEHQKKKVYIANITKPKYPRFVSSKKKKNKIYATTKSLGTYTLKYDYTKPSVKLINFKNKNWISKLNHLKVKISDKTTGIRSWKATIDGKWILMEFNHKKGILSYNLNDIKFKNKKHLFKIIVSDNVGNTKSLSATFYRVF